ncbi:hypothetical protein CKO33_11355 [Ectothiorhodospira mobilis]|nr:hypothetical protein [Ectothiorhodospira mobilis]
MSDGQYISLPWRGIFFFSMVSTLLLAGGFVTAAYAQMPPAESEESVHRQAETYVDGRITALGSSSIQLDSGGYALSDAVSVFDQVGQPIRINALREGMDVRCQLTASPSGGQVVHEIRVMVR